MKRFLLLCEVISLSYVVFEILNFGLTVISMNTNIVSNEIKLVIQTIVTFPVFFLWIFCIVTCRKKDRNTPRLIWLFLLPGYFMYYYFIMIKKGYI